MALISKIYPPKTEEAWVAAITLLLALLMAAHQSAQYPVFGVVGTYLYWMGRIFIESAFFFTVLWALEKYLKQLIPEWVSYALAILLSLVPFTLTITALDLIVGLPELGFNGDTAAPDAKGKAFGLELFYLLDNHICLSILLLIPRFLFSALDPGEVGEVEQVDTIAHEESALEHVVEANTPLSFFDTLEPTLDGHICSMEAQEHYIHITTTQESRMVLHRFSDAVRQTPDALGMRVHRSHWVAHSAVQEIVTEGQSMKLRLTDDKVVPVSRTFRAAVTERYATA